VDDLLAGIDPETRTTLQRYGFDEALFERLRAGVRSGRLSAEANRLSGRIEPPGEDDVVRLPAPGEPGRQQAYETGAAAIRDGAVAMAVLNGGMATRFGGVVKGIVVAVDGRSFLEWKLVDAQRTASALGGRVPCVIMDSFATDEATREHLVTVLQRDRSLSEPLQFTQFV